MNHNLMWVDWATNEYRARARIAERDGWKLQQLQTSRLSNIVGKVDSLSGRLQKIFEAIAGKKNDLEEAQECCV